MTTEAKPEAEKKEAEKKEKPKGTSVADLAKEFDMEPRAIRLYLRSEGFKARGEGGEGGTYDFAPNGPELKKVRAGLKSKKDKAAQAEKDKAAEEAK